tara:strand:- start:668 stop:1009 length:342 start_codon:yes stop_codon:yes gene_type:complete
MINKTKLFIVFPTVVIYLAVVVSFLANFIDVHGSFVSNTIGYSILFNFVILYFLNKLKYCIHTRVAMCNLIVLNLFNLLNTWNIIDYDTYYLTYDLITLAIMFLIMLIYSVKK